MKRIIKIKFTKIGNKIKTSDYSEEDIKNKIYQKHQFEYYKQSFPKAAYEDIAYILLSKYGNIEILYSKKYLMIL